MTTYIVDVHCKGYAHKDRRAYYQDANDVSEIYATERPDERMSVTEAPVGAALIPARAMLVLRSLNWNFGRGDICGITYDSVSGMGKAHVVRKYLGIETPSFRIANGYVHFRSHKRRMR